MSNTINWLPNNNPGSIWLTASGQPLPVTSTQENPVYVTGTLAATVSTTTIESSVGGTGSIAPFSATLIAGKSGTDLVPLSSTSDGRLWVTGNFATSFPVTQSVVANITQSVPLTVTATSLNPVTVTGVVGISGPISISGPSAVTFTSQSVTGTVSIGNTPAVTFTSQSVTGTVSIGNVIPTHGVTFVSQSVTGSVTVDNLVKIVDSLGNNINTTTAIPAGGARGLIVYNITSGTVQVTASAAAPVAVTGVVGISGPVATTFTSQSVTGTVSVGNIVSVSMSSAAASAIWVTGTVAANITASISSQNNSVSGTGSLAPFSATLLGVKNDAGSMVPVSGSALGAIYVSSTQANPIFITGSISANSVNPSVAGTGSAPPFSASLLGGVSGTTMVAISASSAGALFVTGNISAVSVNPSVGGTGSATPFTGTLVGGNNAGTFVPFSASSAGAQVVTASSTNPVAVTGVIGVSGPVATTFTSQSVTGAISVPNLVSVTMSSAPASAVWVTGNFATSNGSIGGTASLAPFSATLLGVKNDAGNMLPLSGSPLGAAYVSSTVANPVQVTGVVGVSGPVATTFTSQSITGTVSIGNTVPVTMSTTAASAVWITGTVAANVTASINTSNPSVAGTGSSTPISATYIGLRNDSGQVVGASGSALGALYVTSTQASPIFITGSISANSVNPSVAGTGSAPPFSASLLGGVSGTTMVAISASSAGALFVTGNISAVSVNPAVAGTSSATPFSATLVGGNNAGTFVPFSATSAGAQFVTASVANPVQVTGVVGISGPAAVTFTSQSVTGTVSVGNVVTVTSTFSASVFANTLSERLTGSASPLYAGLIGGNNAGTLTPFSATSVGAMIVTSSGGNVAVTATVANPVQITGVVGLSPSTLPVTFTSQSVTGAISVPNLVSVTMSTAAASAVWVTGTVAANVTASINATNPSVAGTGSSTPISATYIGLRNDSGQVVGASGSSLGAMYVTSTNTNPVWVAVSGNMSASFSGTMFVTSTSAAPVWVTGTVAANVTASINATNASVATTATATPSSVTYIGVNLGGNAVGLSGTSAGALFVTSTVSSPLWVTGTVAANITASVNASAANVGATGSATPIQAGLVGGNNAGTLVPFSGTVDGRQFVTSTAATPVFVSSSTPLIVSSSAPLWVTSTLALPQYVTGIIGVSGPVTFTSQSVTGTVSVGNVVTVTSTFSSSIFANILSERLTGTASPLYANQIGGNNAGTLTPFSASSAGALPVTATVASPVQVTGVVGISGPAAVTFTSQSVTGAISVPNLVSVTMSSAAASAIWVTGTVAANVTASINASAANVGLTGAATPLQAGLIGGNNAGTLVPLSATTAGAVFITASVANPAQITGTIHIDNTNLGGGTQYGTGSVTNAQTGTLMLGNAGGTLVALSSTTAGAVWITSSAANPAQITGTVGLSVGTLAVSQSTAAGSAIWITGSVFQTNPTSIPVTQSVVANITQSIPLTVTATSANPIAVTGVIGVSGPVSVTSTAAAPVFISSSVPLIVSSSAPLWVTSTLALPQYVTGVVGVSGPVSVTFTSQSVTGTVSVGNFPVTQSVVANITQSIPLSVTSTAAAPVWVTGTVAANVTASINATNASVVVTATATPSSVTYMGVNLGGNAVGLSGTSAGALWVSASVGNPVWVTGTVAANITASVNASAANVGLTGAATPLQAGLIGGNNAGTHTPFSASAAGAMFFTSTIAAPAWVAISGALTAIVSGTQDTNIVSSIPLSVTSTAAAPVWVTGTVAANVTASISVAEASVRGTGTAAPFSATLIGGNNAGNLIPFSASATGGQFVTSTVAAPVWITGTVAANVTASISSQNNSIGGTASLAPFSATLIGLKDDSGNIRPLSGSSNGVLYVAISGAMDAVFSGTQIVTSTIASPIWTVDVPSTVGALTSTNVTNAAQTILTSSVTRLGATVYNQGPNIAYVRLGSGSSFTAFTVAVASGAYYEVPFRYTGIVTAATSGTQTATVRCTDLLP